MRDRLQKITKSPAARLITGTTLSQLILVLSSIVLTRVYSPHDFGVFSTALNIVLLASINGSLRYQLAIVIEEDEQNVSHITILSVLIAIAKTLLFCIVALIAVKLAHFDMQYLNNITYILLCIFLFFTISLNQVLYQLGLRQKDYVSISRSKIVEALGTSSFQFILHSFGTLGLLIGRSIGATCTSIALARNGMRQKSNANFVFDFRQIKYIVFRYKDFPIFSTPAALLNSASARMPLIYFAFSFGPASAGLFVISQRLLSTPISMIGVAMSDLVFNASMEAKKQKNLKFFTARLIFLASACVIPLSIILFFMLPHVFGVFLPQEWHDSGFIAQYLIPMAATQFLVTIISKILISIERQKLSLFIQLFSTIAKLCPLFFSWWLNFSLLESVAIYSAAGTISNVFAIALTYKAAAENFK